jgi:hypothetical protein
MTVVSVVVGTMERCRLVVVLDDESTWDKVYYDSKEHSKRMLQSYELNRNWVTMK